MPFLGVPLSFESQELSAFEWEDLDTKVKQYCWTILPHETVQLVLGLSRAQVAENSELISGLNEAQVLLSRRRKNSARGKGTGKM